MLDPFVAALARAFPDPGDGRPLLLAISGGADSMALLHAASVLVGKRRLTEVHAAHVDHGLRSDSGEVAAKVVELSNTLGIPCESVRVHVDVRDGGLEEAARKVRYTALGDVARRRGARTIVTAHTATDQAETLLLRLLRGTGRRGLAGMRAQRPLDETDPDSPVLFRPLLSMAREETRAYCARAAIWFHDDPGNLDGRPRARLRAAVLPVLESLQAGAVSRIAATAGRLAEEEAWLSAEARRHLIEGGGTVETLVSLELPLLRRVLGQWAEGACGTSRRLAGAHVEALVQLVRTGRGEVELPASEGERLVARVVEGRVVATRRPRSREEP